jgi:hypothetical protein
VVGGFDARQPSEPQLIVEIAERVRELASAYEPPDFAHAPGLDAALFLCAIDHRSGYRRAYLVGG